MERKPGVRGRIPAAGAADGHVDDDEERPVERPAGSELLLGARPGDASVDGEGDPGRGPVDGVDVPGAAFGRGEGVVGVPTSEGHGRAFGAMQAALDQSGAVVL